MTLNKVQFLVIFLFGWCLNAEGMQAIPAVEASAPAADKPLYWYDHDNENVKPFGQEGNSKTYTLSGNQKTRLGLDWFPKDCTTYKIDLQFTKEEIHCLPAYPSFSNLSDCLDDPWVTTLSQTDKKHLQDTLRPMIKHEKHFRREARNSLSKTSTSKLHLFLIKGVNKDVKDCATSLKAAFLATALEEYNFNKSACDLFIGVSYILYLYSFVAILMVQNHFLDGAAVILMGTMLQKYMENRSKVILANHDNIKKDLS